MPFEAARIDRPGLIRGLPKCPLDLKDGGRFPSNLCPGGSVLKNSGYCYLSIAALYDRSLKKGN